MISQFAGVAITTSVRESSVLAPPDITISPLHTSEFQLTVFKSVDSSLSVLRLVKLASISAAVSSEPLTDRSVKAAISYLPEKLMLLLQN